MKDTEPLLRNTDFPGVRRDNLSTLQVNLGYLCNLSCTHCHVNAGPKRTELMDLETIELILRFIDVHGISVLDLTGGAPEMNPHFRYLVAEARKRDCAVIDRCNLTILSEPGYEDLARFLAEQQVQVVASLPCYEEDNVDQQRGNGVYVSSIEALKTLNSFGYGVDPKLSLDLVYNPTGPFLPPPQQGLERDYKEQLRSRFGVHFNSLLTITNMPISRFGAVLLAHDQFDDYVNLLKENFAPDNMASLMCKSLISVDWQGQVYDCDFNQMLHWPMRLQGASEVIGSDKAVPHIRDLLDRSLVDQEVVIGEHCYGCTAGQGSSCSGALN